MKKKLLAIFLCVAVAISAMAFAACGGGNAYFNGNYEATTKEEVASYAEAVSTNPESTNLDWSKGLSIDFKLKGNLGGGDVNVTMNYKVGLVNEALVASGNINMKDVVSSISGSIYYADGYQYINGSVGVVGGASASGKFKSEMSYDDFIDEYGITSVLIEDLSEVLPFLQQYQTVNFFVEEGVETLKIKIEIPRQTITQGEGDYTSVINGSGSYVFVYDTENNLIGFHADMVSDTTVNTPMGQSKQTVNITLDITPFDGVINLPSDLDSYANID